MGVSGQCRPLVHVAALLHFGFWCARVGVMLQNPVAFGCWHVLLSRDILADDRSSQCALFWRRLFLHVSTLSLHRS
jgi:hypothetical protein